MTPEELKALMAAATNPDTAAEALTSLHDKVLALMSETDKLKSDKAEADKTIGSLRDTNMRLFLRTTGAEPNQDEPKKVQEMDRNELKEFFAQKMKEATENAQS